MNNEKTLKTWQSSIQNDCEKKLGRKLTSVEKTFIESRNGFIALETIEDTVSNLSGKELENYLNSESDEK